MTAPIPREHFLPANSTKFETSLSESLARVNDVPVAIDTLWSWDKCPLSHLPWLAWALSVDIWSQDWPEHKKRLVCKESFAVHRLKGTLAGVRKYLEYADAVLVDAVLPPQEGYADDFDQEYHDWWLSQLPQVHIKPRVLNDNDFTAYFDVDYFDDAFLSINDTGHYIKRDAFLIDGDEETPLQWVDGGDSLSPDILERLAIPSRAPFGALFFGDGYFDDEYFLGDYRAELLDLISLERGGASQIIKAGYQATSVSPELVPIVYYAAEDELYFDDGFFDYGYFSGNELQPEFYEKFYLYKEQQLGHMPPDPYAYFDDTRFGFDEFTAELTVKIQDGTDDKYYLYFDDGYFDDGYITDPDFRDVWAAFDAINMSKSLRDDVWVDTAYKRQVTFGDNVLLGDLVLGEFIEGKS